MSNRICAVLSFCVFFVTGCEKLPFEEQVVMRGAELKLSIKKMLTHLEVRDPDERQLQKILKGLREEPSIGEFFPIDELTDAPEVVTGCTGWSGWWYKGGGLWEKWEEVCCARPGMEGESCTWNKVKSLCLGDLNDECGD